MTYTPEQMERAQQDSYAAQRENLRLFIDNHGIRTVFSALSGILSDQIMDLRDREIEEVYDHRRRDLHRRAGILHFMRERIGSLHQAVPDDAWKGRFNFGKKEIPTNG